MPRRAICARVWLAGDRRLPLPSSFRLIRPFLHDFCSNGVEAVREEMVNCGSHCLRSSWRRYFLFLQFLSLSNLATHPFLGIIGEEEGQRCTYDE